MLVVTTIAEITIKLDDQDESQTVFPFERQEIEPAMYAHTSGWWCSADGFDADFFVSDDGLVYDGEDNQVVGVCPEWKAASDKAQAEIDRALVESFKHDA